MSELTSNRYELFHRAVKIAKDKQEELYFPALDPNPFPMKEINHHKPNRNIALEAYDELMKELEEEKKGSDESC